MELRHLRYFVAAAEHGGFAAAARRVHVSPQTLAAQVGDLERELGVPLFERAAPGLRLTAAGAAFLDGARRALAEADGAVRRARAVGPGGAGVLTVASVELGLRSGLVPRAVRRLRARAPGLEVAVREMTSLPQWEAVRDGAAAAGVCYTPPPADDPDLAADWLLNDPLAVALVAADHPLGGGAADGRSGDPPAAPLAVLADEPLLLFPRAVNPIFHDRLFAAFRAAGFRPRVLEQASDGQGAYALAAEGLGWTLQPASYAAAPPPGTAAVRLVDFALPLSLHLLRRRDGRPPAARVFGAAVRAVLRAGGRGAPEAT